MQPLPRPRGPGAWRAALSAGALALLLLCLLRPTTGRTAPAAADELPPAVQAALAQAEVPASALAVQIEEVGGGRPRLLRQAHTPMNPASLMKLYTTYAGLERLGPAWVWTTPVWLKGRLRDPGPQGVLEGSVHVQGRGDPTLVMERVWLLLRKLRQQGVREIRGDIVLDRQALADAPVSPAAFDDDPSRPYNVRADALMLNFKAITLNLRPDPAQGVAWIDSDPVLAGLQLPASVPLAAGPCGAWRSGLKPEQQAEGLRLGGRYPTACGPRSWSLAHPQPERYNAQLIEQAWRDLGGSLQGSVRDGPAPVDETPSFVFESRPLADAVRDLNKYSNNVMAQQLFLTLGLTLGGAGTPEAARAVLAQFALERTGCRAPELVIDNGSGLSRSGRSSAACLAALLQSAWKSPVMPELLASLPVAGVDGTARKGKALNLALGRAHLKTGTLDDSTGLAGIVLGRSGRRYVFVAMLNHPRAGAARPALEALVDWTADDR